MYRIRRVGFIAWMAAVGFAQPDAAGTPAGITPAGAARVDITPEEPMRLCGYASRKTVSEGTEQPLYARALVVGSDEDGVAVLLAVDNVGVPMPVTEELARRLKARTGIPRERFVIASSHTHTGPCLTGAIPNMFGEDLPPDQQAAIDRYTRRLTDDLEKAALAAIADRRPAALAWGQGTATFAANRRTPGGPVDHALPILRVADPDGGLRAVVANYACHCTTLTGAHNKVCGDWAGYAQEYIERDHPGVVALLTIGCGADANPVPRGELEMARRHGEEIAAEVARLLKTELIPLTDPPVGRFKRIELPFDTPVPRETWEQRAAQDGAMGYYARKQLARLDRGEALPTTLDYPVQTWTFGDDLAMVFLAGEVVVDYALRLKTAFEADRLWVTAYANDVPCYIPSKRILSEGGYEAEGAMMYYDLPGRLAPAVEDLIVRTVHELLPQSFRTGEARAAFPPPMSPEEALAAFVIRDDLEVELVAAEPLVIDPVAIDWGLDGRLWVVEMRDYPTGLHENWAPGGRIRVLEDTNGDGHYDTATVFLDAIPFPTGVMPWRKGALICAAPEVFYAEDTTGDGRADLRRTLLSGFATDNYQARVNSLQIGLDNWVYGATGLNVSTMHSRLTGQDISISGRDFRFDPDTGAAEAVSGLTQFGRTRDDWGNWFGGDNSNLIWHFPLPDHYVRRNPHVASPHPRVYLPSGPQHDLLFPASRTLERFNEPQRADRVTSACKPAIYRDEFLGEEFTGNAFICENVHNLVHRLVLEDRGVTFAARRAEGEEESEFLASTDNWFRPVQVRTGPDGALWVVDMYRFVIEHPRWIPADMLAGLDIRAGDDRGRIYRIVPKGRKARPLYDLGGRTSEELAHWLSHPSGTFRDVVHRELLHRGDDGALPVLRRLLRYSERPATRVQTLTILDGLEALTTDDLDTALRDGHPAVRRHAVRLSESLLKAETSRTNDEGRDEPHRGIQRRDEQSRDREGATSPNETLPDAILQLADDPDIRVRYQVALTLGEWNDPRTAEALAQLAMRDLNDTWMRAAVLSSATRWAPRILNTILTSETHTPAMADMIEKLIATAAATGHDDDLVKMLSIIAPPADTAPSAWQLSALAGLFDALENRQVPLAALFADGAHRDVTDRLTQVFDAARRDAADEAADEALRDVAVRLLGRTRDHETEDLALLAELLQPYEPLRVQTAALAAISRSRGDHAPQVLLNAWASASPSLRSRVLDALLSRRPWIDPLLDQLEHGALRPDEIPAAHRELLFNHADEQVRKRATELLAAVRPPRRADVLEAYRPALDLDGDPGRGRALFSAHCATCHAFRGEGFDVGPNLAALSDRSGPALLTAILDPNAAVESHYVNYIVETDDGRSLSGIITGETAGSLTLVQGGGARETILRNRIIELRSSNLSMMPEGIEQDMTPQDLADLIAWVQSGPVPLGGSTTDQIAEARRRFADEGCNGLTEVIAAMDVHPHQPSWLGTLPMHYCRQTDGNARVSWRTAAVPSDLAPDAMYAFRLPVAMGLRSQPAGHFTLRMNIRRQLDFNVVLNDASWRNADGKVRMDYTVMAANNEDSTGVLVIEIHASLLEPGEPVVFEVIGSAAGSLRWFGLLPCPEPPADKCGTAVSPVNKEGCGTGVSPVNEKSSGTGAPPAERTDGPQTIQTAPATDTIDALCRVILAEDTPEPDRQAALTRRPAAAAELVACLVADLEPGTPEEYRRIPWIWRVSIQAGRRNDPDELRRLLNVSLPKADEPLHDWQAVVLGGGVINGLGLENIWPAERVADLLADHEELKERWDRANALASPMSDDEKIPTGTRYDALRMIAMDGWTRRGEQLVQYLAEGVNAELQQGAISGLADIKGAPVAVPLLSGWAHYTPSNRNFVLDALLREPARTAALLDAVDDGRITPDDLGEQRIERLRSHPDADLRARARGLLADQLPGRNAAQP